MHSLTITLSEDRFAKLQEIMPTRPIMFTGQRVQKWPGDFVYNDEQMRFGQAGRLSRMKSRS